MKRAKSLVVKLTPKGVGETMSQFFFKNTVYHISESTFIWQFGVLILRLYSFSSLKEKFLHIFFSWRL